MNTYEEPHAIADNECVVATNVSFAKPGQIESRNGFERANTTAAAGSVLGIFEYFKEDGTAIRVLKAGTTFHSFTIDSSDDITISSSLGVTGTSSFKPWFVGFQNKVLIFDSGANFAYDGTNITELGRDGPTGITLAETTGGSLTTTSVYSYKFSFFSTALNIESTLSATFTITLTGVNNAVTVTMAASVTDELDSVWDEINVYRTVGDGAEFLFRTPRVTGTFTDTVADASLGAAAVDTSLFKLPGAVAAIEYQGRVFARISTEITNAYFTEAGFADQWKSSNVLRVGEQDGDELRGFIKQSGRLIAIKEHSLYTLVGDSAANYEWFPIEGARGGPAGRAAVVASGIAYVFNSRDWIYRFRGSGVQPIGWKIRDFVQDTADPNAAEDNFVAEYEPKTESVWFSVRRKSLSINDRILVFFARTGAWSIYEIEAESLALIHRGSDNELRLLIGDSDGFLSWAEESSTDGNPASGTTSGTVGTGSTATVIESEFTIFVGDSFTDMFLTVVYANGTVERGKILTYGSDNITLRSALSNGAPASGDLWFVGGIDFQWKGKLSDLGDPFYDKRCGVCIVALNSPTSSELLRARVNIDANTGTFTTKDVSSDRRFPFGVSGVGSRFQAELRHIANDAPMVVTGISMPAARVDQLQSQAR